MSESNQQNLDRLIREAMDEKIMDCPSPKLSAVEAWEKLEKARNKGAQPYRKRRFPKKVFLAVAMLFVVFMLASYPRKGVAFNRWSELFTQAQGSVVQLFGSSGTQPEHEDGQPEFYIIEDASSIAVTMNLEEAQKVTNFTISVPSVPPEFKLEHVTVMEETDGRSNEVYLHYKGNERELVVTERALEGQFSFGMSVDREDTTVEELTLNGQPGSLITFKNGFCTLTWMTQSHYFQVEGELTKDEIVQIAKSM